MQPIPGDDRFIRDHLRQMDDATLCELLRHYASESMSLYCEEHTVRALGHEALARIIERTGSPLVLLPRTSPAVEKQRPSSAGLSRTLTALELAIGAVTSMIGEIQRGTISERDIETNLSVISENLNSALKS